MQAALRSLGAARPLARRAPVQVARRKFGGGVADDGGGSGLALHRPQVLNSRVAKVVSTTMWFWIMYRGYHDLPHMIYLHQPWEHGDHPPDLSDEDDVFLANLKAQTAK